MSIQAKLAALLVVLVLWAGSLWYGYHHGLRNGANRAQIACTQADVTRKDAEIASLTTTIESNRLIQKANDARNLKATQDHEQADKQREAALNRLRHDLDATGGLRIDAAICHPAPASTASPSAGRPDEAGAATVRFPERVESFLLGFASRCDQVADQLRGIEAWATSQGHYGATTP